MNISSNPERILLNLHPTTRLRMKNALLPIGVSRTRWINAAICEKLDRDQPQTAIQPEPQKIDPQANLKQAKPAAESEEDAEFWGDEKVQNFRTLVKKHN